MVYLGPSQGCTTCKQRKKKCDQTRPSCVRCAKAKRTCGGYEDELTQVFRKHRTNEDVSSDWPTDSFESIARRCRLPVRAPVPGLEDMPKDQPPNEETAENIEEHALRAFVYEFSTTSVNQNLSRGYLHGLEGMLRSRGRQSSLAKACRAVALVSHSKTLNRPSLSVKGERFYQNLLSSMTQAVGSVSGSKALFKDKEILAVIVLLGMYEIMLASEMHLSNHGSHTLGAAAVLHTEPSLCSLLTSMARSCDCPSSTLEGAKRGAFYLPGSNVQSQSLDELVAAVEFLWQRANDFFEIGSVTKQTHFAIMKELLSVASEINEELLLWSSSRTVECNPRTVGYLQRSHWFVGSAQVANPIRWPARVDTYFDLYVAAVWNILRVTRMALLCMMIEFSKLLQHDVDGSEQWRKEFLRLADDLLASIPYHLTTSVDDFLQRNSQETHFDHKSSSPPPAKAAGGLLLMHPLFIASQLPLVSDDMRSYMQFCLAWIGERMGIGQASVLAKAACRMDCVQLSTDEDTSSTPEVSPDYVESGLFIVWAGVFL